MGVASTRTEILGALAFHRASNNGDVLKIKISREHWTDRVTLPDGTLMDDRELGDRGIYLEIINRSRSPVTVSYYGAGFGITLFGQIRWEFSGLFFLIGLPSSNYGRDCGLPKA